MRIQTFFRGLLLQPRKSHRHGKRTARLSVSVDPDTVALVEQMARLDGRSVSDYVTDLLERHLYGLAERLPKEGGNGIRD